MGRRGDIPYVYPQRKDFIGVNSQEHNREDLKQRVLKGKGYIRENREVFSYTHLWSLSGRSESDIPHTESPIYKNIPLILYVIF